MVVGAGVIGRAIACALQADGSETLLVDSTEAPRGASWGNAGHIATEQVEPLASPAMLRAVPSRLFWRGGPLSLPLREAAAWLPFAVRLVAASRPRRFAAGRVALGRMLAQAMPAWRTLVADAGTADLLREDGHYVVWETPASAADGLRRWRAADIGDARVHALDGRELVRLQALTTVPLAGGVRFEGSGHIADLGALADALDGLLARRGGMRRHAKVARIAVERGHARLVLDDGSPIDADAIVVAAGARSGALLRPLGHVVPLIAERGYHIQSRDADWPADMPPVVFEDRAMIVTRFRSGLRAASFVEFARVDGPPDRRKWERLRRHVAALGLRAATFDTEWTGARPTLPDYLPAIGRSARADNLFYAFGHQHLGLTLAAITGEAVAALVSGMTPPIDLAPFDLARFGARR